MDDTPDAAAEELPPFRIEPARSSRSKCKACRRKIDKGVLRFGRLVEGFYGPGYLWHHLTCMARREIERVEEAYELSCWDEGVEVPPLDELRKLAEKAARHKRERKPVPRIEIAPSGRSRCKVSDQLIPQGAPRVVLLRVVRFGNQERAAPVNVLPEHVRDELDRDDSGVDRSLLLAELRANSEDVPREVIEEVIARIGELD